MKQFVFACLLLMAILLPAATEKNVYHAHKVSPYVVRVTCDNGADATVVTDSRIRAMIGNDGILISCGDMRKPATLSGK